MKSYNKLIEDREETEKEITFHREYDSGNYDSSYECLIPARPDSKAYLLGFFSDRELSEIEFEYQETLSEIRDELNDYMSKIGIAV